MSLWCRYHDTYGPSLPFRSADGWGGWW